VTDCEDDPNEENGAQDMEADNIPGEFDDDY